MWVVFYADYPAPNGFDAKNWGKEYCFPEIAYRCSEKYSNETFKVFATLYGFSLKLFF